MILILALLLLGAIETETRADTAANSQAAAPLQDLAVRHLGADQGVYVETADRRILVDQAADRPVHPASVTKVATTLALLRRLGSDHRFETRIAASGPIESGHLRGDLVWEASRDPFFVFESAFLVLQRLRELGVARVDGGFVMRGALLFNWQPDPSGQRLLRALQGKDGEQAWVATNAARPSAAPDSLPAAGLAFGSTAPRSGAGDEGHDTRTLVTHRSPPLLHIVKTFNEYSNNVFHLVSPEIGGPSAVEEIARTAVPSVTRGEIIIDNGAGAGTTNRMSPRAAVALLWALEADLKREQHDLTSVLPVSGIDPGTLDDRLPEHPGVIVGKTGTYGDVGASALAGVLTTRRYGEVAFAILNSWVPVPEARHRQDAFVRALIGATDAAPWPYDRASRPQYLSAEVR